MKFRTKWRTDRQIHRALNRHWRREIKQFLDGPEWRNILDLGGGTGGVTVGYASKSRVVVCLDISEERVRRGHKSYGKVQNFHYVIGDASVLPFKDSSFDIVHCTAALHHLPDPEKALNEVYRVAKPGGKLLLLEPGILNPLACVSRKFFRTTSHDPAEKPFVPSKLERMVSQKFVNVVVKHYAVVTYIMPHVLPRLRGLSWMLKPLLPYLIHIDDHLSTMLKEFAGVIVIKAEKLNSYG